MKFLNSNYGREIDDKFAQILSEIDASNDDKNVILITDLNLSLAQCETLREIDGGKNIKLFLDHHKVVPSARALTHGIFG